jgi:hypothetical protein
MTQPDEVQRIDWGSRIFQVFNPDQSVGAACDRDGAVVGLHISDEARDEGDNWLSEQIVRAAGLAHMKSRLGLREEMEFNGTKPYVISSFGLPTAADYDLAERTAFESR